MQGRAFPGGSVRVLVVIVALLCAACAPRGQLVLSPETPPTGEVQTIFVATTRSLDDETGRFGRDRAETVRHARYGVAIPANRKAGEIGWPPRSGRVNPDTDFFTTEELRHPDEAAFSADLRRALADMPKGSRDAVIFVHGFNNTFSEGLYRIAQLGHDLNLPGVVMHYSWPSAGSPLAYVHDRDSALFARDGLERLISVAVGSGAERVILVAHSMGSALTMEALRQAAIRNGDSIIRRIGGVILISPDLDVDVFRAQAHTMDTLPQPFLIFGSSRDRVLNIAARLTGEPERLGNLTDLGRIADLDVTFLDTGAYATGSGHFTVGNSPALLQLLEGIGDIDRAFGADERGRIGLLPGVVLTAQSATKIILAPVSAISEELSPQ
jgi:esterase/lipase superfamily enzyme